MAANRTLPGVQPPLPPIPPDDALASLVPSDVDLAGGVGLRHEAAVPVWYGIVWGRLGRGDLAVAHFDRVRLPELQPWIAAERGRLLREFGLHADAEAIEWPALLATQDRGDPVDEVMLRLSLAADAVGMGDVDRAVRRLAAARDALGALPNEAPRVCRQRLRLAWVTCEVAWLEGPPPPTDGLPWWDEARGAPAFPVEQRWGTDFHRAKGLLFAGVARGDLRLLDAAAAIAPVGLLWAVHLARRDAGAPDAEVAARHAWAQVVPPPEYAGRVTVPV
jgi:hypothetical protein